MAERWKCPNCKQTLERTANMKAGPKHSVPNWSVVLTKAETEDKGALQAGTYRGMKRQ